MRKLHSSLPAALSSFFVNLDFRQAFKRLSIEQSCKMFLHIGFVGHRIFAAGSVFGQDIAYFVKLFRRMAALSGYQAVAAVLP